MSYDGATSYVGGCCGVILLDEAGVRPSPGVGMLAAPETHWDVAYDGHEFFAWWQD